MTAHCKGLGRPLLGLTLPSFWRPKRKGLKTLPPSSKPAGTYDDRVHGLIIVRIAPTRAVCQQEPRPSPSTSVALFDRACSCERCPRIESLLYVGSERVRCTRPPHIHDVVDLQQFAVGIACCLEEAYAARRWAGFLSYHSSFGALLHSLFLGARHNATQSSPVHAEESLEDPLFTGQVRGR